MDVLKVLLLCVSLFFAVACNKQAKTVDGVLANGGSASCKNQAIPSEYVAKWSDGHISTYKTAEHDGDVRVFVEQNLNDLELVEPNYKLSIPESVETESAMQPQAIAPVNWGVARIHADQAWARGVQGENVIVAVIDSGVNVNHAQLKNQIAYNTGEIPGNGIDDDHNGYVDDYAGYNFQSNSGVMQDVSGHGTHVSGIIAAEHTANASLPKGVAPKAKILPVAFMAKDSAGNVTGSTGAAIQGIAYAVSRGAKVINASWGGTDCSELLRQAIVGLRTQNVFFVVSAGNNGVDIQYNPVYPAAYNIEQLITVAASTVNGLEADYSNYSHSLVHVAAPGSDIYSTYASAGLDYAYLSGTSMAAPHVSGALALLVGHSPALDMMTLRKALFDGVNPTYFPVLTRGEINVNKSVDILENAGH